MSVRPGGGQKGGNSGVSTGERPTVVKSEGTGDPARPCRPGLGPAVSSKFNGKSLVSGEQRIEEASKGWWEGKLLSHRASPEGYDDSSNRTERGKRENAYREKWEDSRDVSDTEGLWTT